MGRMDGKVALITGAARGQGRAHAVRLAQEGADVIVLDVCATIASTAYTGPTPADLEHTASLIRGCGRRAIAREADVRDTGALQRVVEEGIAELGHIDTVCANAGISFLKPAWELTDDEWQRVIDINLTGAFKTARAAIPHMIERGAGGSLIFISSVGGLVGIPNITRTFASKHGLVGLMRSLAAELAPHNIRANSVHPGTVRTPMIDSPELFRQMAPDGVEPPREQIMSMYQSLNALPTPWIEPEDVSNAVVFLASDEARYITGVTLPVDAGMSMPMKVPHAGSIACWTRRSASTVRSGRVHTATPRGPARAGLTEEHMSGRLDGRVAIVTGAASGFGEATALAFGREGAKVVVSDLDGERGQGVVDRIVAGGSEADLVVGDVTTMATADAQAARAVDRWGRLDILVNNAGIAYPGSDSTWDMSEERWDHMIRTNLRSVYVCSKAAIPIMIEAHSGSIVNVASIAATTAIGGAAYGAAKGGMLSYSRHVAAELGPHEIRVNCVSPGYMRTPMTTGERDGWTPEQTAARMQRYGTYVPLGRAGSADDIANAILYLASDEAAYVTGQEIVVDGGWRVRGPYVGWDNRPV